MNFSRIIASSFFKKIKHVLTKYETLIVYSIGLVLFAVAVSRIKSALETLASVDGQCWVKTARCILNGISPYHKEVYTALTIMPVQSPGVSVIFMPICTFSRVFQNLFFFFVPLLFYYGFVILVFYYYGFHPKDYLKPRWSNLPVWIVLMLVLISSPLMLMISSGQISSMATLFLFAALFFPAGDKSVNFIFLGLAAALKYSLLTFQVPVLLIQKRFRMAVAGFALFAVLVLSVGLWLDGIISAFVEYVQMLFKDVHSGINSYQNGGDPTFLYVGFFKYGILNNLFRVGILAAYAFALWRIYCRSKKDGAESVMHLSCAEWGLFTAMTCVFSYHRIHDGVLFMPFLGVLFLEQCKQASSCKKVKSAFLLLFLLFWACPRKIILYFGQMITTFFPEGIPFIRYGSMNYNGGILVSFPIFQCMMLMMLFLLAWIVFSEHKDSAPVPAESTQEKK